MAWKLSQQGGNCCRRIFQSYEWCLFKTIVYYFFVDIETTCSMFFSFFLRPIFRKPENVSSLWINGGFWNCYYYYCIHSSSGGKSGCLGTGRLPVRSPVSVLPSVEVSLSKTPPNPNCSRRVGCYLAWLTLNILYLCVAVQK